MTKCYNPDSARADLAVVVNQHQGGGWNATNPSDKQRDIMKSITYEQKLTKSLPSIFMRALLKIWWST